VLLGSGLASAARDSGSRLGRCVALALVRLLGDQRLMDERLVHRHCEHIVGQRGLADGLAA
jgi:hypothetical protein